MRESEDAFRDTLAQLLDLPIVGDLRGTGFFYALELVKDKDSRETFSEEECERLLRGYLSNALFDAGLICRADDRGDPRRPVPLGDRSLRPETARTRRDGGWRDPFARGPGGYRFVRPGRGGLTGQSIRSVSMDLLRVEGRLCP